jgi:hypothetical protein
MKLLIHFLILPNNSYFNLSFRDLLLIFQFKFGNSKFSYLNCQYKFFSQKKFIILINIVIFNYLIVNLTD